LAIDDFSIGIALAPRVAGDYNNNGIVDAADYVVWRERLNQAVTIQTTLRLAAWSHRILMSGKIDLESLIALSALPPLFQSRHLDC